MSDPSGARRELDSEDAKLILLARAARGRTGASEGAAVRDSDGRTFVAASVTLPSLALSALQAAVAAAVASGVTRLEAAAVVSAAEAADRNGVSAVRDLSDSAPVFVAGIDGRLVRTEGDAGADGPPAPGPGETADVDSWHRRATGASAWRPRGMKD